jgi:hypothetical protein
MRGHGQGGGKGGTDGAISRDPPFQLSNLRGQYFSDVYKRSKLSLGNRRKEGERDAQKALPAGSAQNGSGDEGSDGEREGKPASGKPSLEDISFSPFRSVCLDDDAELVLSQAEEEEQDDAVQQQNPDTTTWNEESEYLFLHTFSFHFLSPSPPTPTPN